MESIMFLGTSVMVEEFNNQKFWLILSWWLENGLKLLNPQMSTFSIYACNGEKFLS
jgi:hypothetical protein